MKPSMAACLRTRSGTAIAGAVRAMYGEGQTDYSLEPVVLVDQQGKPIGRVEEGDAVVFCCRRGEREIQLTEAFTDAYFDHFPRQQFHHLNFVLLTLYHDKFKDLPVAFAPSKVKDSLGEVISCAGLRQLRVAESEKFAHVTFFFNGGNSRPFPGEEDVCIPSPKGVPYDQVPELSLAQVAGQVLNGLQMQYDLIVANFANGDVIGHTPNRLAKIQCAEAIDKYLGEVLQTARLADYVVFVTADHGNLEEMTNADGTPHVAHTANRAPFILVDPRAGTSISLQDGSLSGIAPTVLSAFQLEQPASMTGAPLVQGHSWGSRRRVLLLILDGWGLGRQDDTNPIFLAHTPVWDELMAGAASSQLLAAGEAVGLQPGKAGNSEAGHMNMGAGRIVLQDDVRLDQALQDGSFYSNEILRRVIGDIRQRNRRLHLIGLLTEKSSHGCLDYPLAVLRMARDGGLKEVYLHMIFDGRSTDPGSAPMLLDMLEDRMDATGLGKVVSGMGRDFALDRDGDYAKTRRAYEALVFGYGRKCAEEE